MPSLPTKIHAPELVESLEWSNSKPLSMSELRGNVVLIDFWDYTCVNCIRTLPYLKEWHRRYKDKNFVIIGVHTPEFEFAKDSAHLKRAIDASELDYPIVNDRDYQIWNSYANRYWPAKYLIDKDGYIRYYHFGEGHYGETEFAIQSLILESDSALVLPPLMEPIRETDQPGAVCYPVTPELYLGYARGRIGNSEGYAPESAMIYNAPKDYREGYFYAVGSWRAHAEYMQLVGSEGSIILRYRAAEVNAVMAPIEAAALPPEIEITQNGQSLNAQNAGEAVICKDGRSFVVVNTPRMYKLVRNPAYGVYELSLHAKKPFEIYAFTFVSCVVKP